MSLHSGSTRVETSRPRTLSISDTSKLDAALDSLRLSAPSPKSKDDGISVQELNGVFLKRVPLVEPNFDDNNTIPSYQYHIENKRNYDVRVLMTFTGDNTKVVAASSSFSQPSGNVVEGVIKKGSSTPFSLVDAANKSKDFNFSADIKIYPVENDVRETELEGVKLYTTITYEEVTATMIFEARNTKDFDIEVEVELKGQLKEKSGSLPFRRVLKVGERAELGRIKSETEIESHWKWTALPEQASSQKGHVQTSELKGVTLKQTLTSGNPTVIQFDVSNSRSARIQVEIDLTGDGEIDFRGQPRPLKGTVQPGHSSFIGAIAIRGDAEVNWKFKEELD